MGLIARVDLRQQRAQIERSNGIDRHFPAAFLAQTADAGLLVRFESGGDARLPNRLGQIAVRLQFRAHPSELTASAQPSPQAQAAC